MPAWRLESQLARSIWNSVTTGTALSRWNAEQELQCSYNSASTINSSWHRQAGCSKVVVFVGEAIPYEEDIKILPSLPSKDASLVNAMKRSASGVPTVVVLGVRKTNHSGSIGSQKLGIIEQKVLELMMYFTQANPKENWLTIGPRQAANFL
jgi:hypothetical protein